MRKRARPVGRHKRPTQPQRPQRTTDSKARDLDRYGWSEARHERTKLLVGMLPSIAPGGPCGDALDALVNTIGAIIATGIRTEDKPPELVDDVIEHVRETVALFLSEEGAAVLAELIDANAAGIEAAKTMGIYIKHECDHDDHSAEEEE